eukprot:TRINITY_DN8731_c0_g2_i1.p1 TRINITY_DN8731_c0_g2~~TRINITY_DN8731_c0_g2_i1.p1  ORF type:complete len:1006 (+),score=161.74 TRINITY_DN8731_c0_g2_i1:352-3018(+)
MEDFQVGTNVFFLYIGGEAPLTGDYLAYGQIAVYAQQFGALVFGLEHRYYGLSNPVPTLTVHNLQWLSAQQALADAAAFVEAMTLLYGDANTQWICFGGSYPGALSAWLRIKYPHLIAGAIASSAPVDATVNFYQYLQVCDASITKYGGATCAAAVSAAFAQVQQILSAGSTGWTQWAQYSCYGHVPQSTLDVSAAAYILHNQIGEYVQYSGEPGQSDIAQLCAAVVNGATPLEGLISVLDDQCVYSSYTGIWQSMNTMVGGAAQQADAANLLWMWQFCTEFGFYQTSIGVASMFDSLTPPTWWQQYCSDVFNLNGFSARSLPAANSTDTCFGAADPKETNILFVNGDIDPWHALSVLEPTSYVDSIFIYGSAHCANMNQAPSNPNITAAQVAIANTIGGWLCPAGSAWQSAVCTQCAAGTYSATAGSTVCSSCPTGTYGAIAGAATLSACTACAAGSYSAATGASGAAVCASCQAGTYSTTGMSSCSLCPSGTYSTMVGATSAASCVSCPAGTWNTASGASVATACNVCPAGTFSMTSGASSISSCEPCPVGTYNTAVGMSSAASCTLCAAGTWGASEGVSAVSSCKPCAAGTYSASAGASSAAACIACPAGTYSTVAGLSAAISCVSCPPGTWSASTGTSTALTCTACAAGSYSMVRGASSASACLPCPAGSASNVTGAGDAFQCTLCPPGSYSTAGASVCLPLSPGSYNAEQGASSASSSSPCPPGSYAGSGAAACTRCAAGTASNVLGAETSAVCSSCTAGFYSAPGATSCSACPAGSYSAALSATTASTCVACASGQYTAIAGSTACSACPPGTDSPPAAVSCIAVQQSEAWWPVAVAAGGGGVLALVMLGVGVWCGRRQAFKTRGSTADMSAQLLSDQHQRL